MTVQTDTDVRTSEFALCNWLQQDYAAKFPLPRHPNASQENKRINYDRLACRTILAWVIGRDLVTGLDEIERRRGKVTVDSYQKFLDFLEEHKRQGHFSSYMEARMTNIMPYYTPQRAPSDSPGAPRGLFLV